MKLLQRFPLVAFALVLLGIVGLCIAQQSVELLLVAGALAAMSWSITEGPRGRFLPRWVSSVLVIAVTLNLGAELLNGGEPWQRAIGRFAVWMTLIKLYEHKTARDYGQLLLLSLLLVLAGAVQSTQLLFGAVLVLYSILGLYAVLLFQVYMAHERSRAARRTATPTGYRLAPPVKAVIGRHLTAHFRLLAVVIAAGGLGLSVLVFLLFPRDLGHAFVPTIQPLGGVQRTGFVASVDLHASSRITQSHRAVFSLTLLDEQDRPVRSEQPVRLRGAVLEVYEGDGRWRPSNGRRSRRINAGPDGLVPLGGGSAPSGPGITQIIRPTADESVLFSMTMPVAVECDGPARIWFDPRGQVLRRDGRPVRDGYRILAHPAPTEQQIRDLVGRRSRRWTEADRLQAVSRWDAERLRSLRRDAVAGLARTLLADAGLPTSGPGRPGSPERYRWHREAAEVFATFLQSGAFAYTLDLSDVTFSSGDPIDPIERFLLETRRGHCEYFASALASLCWNVDIPGRLVTGYVAWDYDESSQEYVVLESNAHAWVEVRTGHYGWTEVDPTPPSTLRELHEHDATLADRLSWFYQRFEGSWNQAVVTYDGDSQGRLVRAIDQGWSGRLSEQVARLREWLAQVNRAFYFGPAGYIWMGVVAFALVLAVLVLVRLMRRSRTIHRRLRMRHLRGGPLQRMLRQLGFYVDMLDVLQSAGVGKPESTPPLQFADQLGKYRPEAADLVRRLTTMFYAGRYGGADLSRAQTDEAADLVKRLATVLRARA